MLWLYNIGIQLYGLIVRLFSPFNTKADLFVAGRKAIFKKIAGKLDASKRHIWFHFASLGEFEQGRPVLEKIKLLYPEKRIVITFFSPSGYEIRKDYPLAEGVFYLPLDTAANAEKLLQAINPEIAVFTKYEYWYHYFKALHTRKIPLYIISGIFRPEQVFFKWYGGFNRRILGFADHFFVQNTESKGLLEGIDIRQVSLSGDTRFDRVAKNASSPKALELAAEFCGNSKALVAGSTWLADEQLLKHLIADKPEWKIIIAPHETDQQHIEQLLELFPGSIRYSELPANAAEKQVLIIDSIGLLSSLYQYGDIAYIGGGFGVGIHNTLEAAAFGLPVIFGPKYDKFQEAKDLIDLGAAMSITNQQALLSAFEKLTADGSAAAVAKDYVFSNTGATDQIIEHLKKDF